MIRMVYFFLSINNSVCFNVPTMPDHLCVVARDIDGIFHPEMWCIHPHVGLFIHVYVTTNAQLNTSEYGF